MKSTKTPEQVEFADLAAALKKEYRYNQSRVARVCRLQPGMVSMVLSGKRNPGGSALELLRREYAQLTDPNYREVKEEKDEITEQIAFLKEKAPAMYRAARLSVAALHSMAVKEESSSKEEEGNEFVEEAKDFLSVAEQIADGVGHGSKESTLPSVIKAPPPRDASGVTRRRR